jgi:TPR repeat protein
MLADPYDRAIRHRDAASYPRAYVWWCRAAEAGDGDAWVDVGYCLEHGIGVRRDAFAAARAFERAIRSDYITEWVQQEACYRLGALLLNRGARVRRRALQLLAEASADGDFPEAAALLSAVEGERPGNVCNCRRGRGRNVRGQARCTLHRGRNRHRA